MSGRRRGAALVIGAALGSGALAGCSREIVLTPPPPPPGDPCPASPSWLPDTPLVTPFTPPPHPESNCPFFQGAWQNFLVAFQPVDDRGTPALLSYATMDTLFQRTRPQASARAYLGNVKQAGGRHILIDQTGRAVYYGMAANPAFARFVAENHLDTAKAVQAYARDPALSAQVFPDGLVEIKTAWQVVDPGDPPSDLADYIVVDTTVPTLSQDPVTGEVSEDKDSPRPALVRLLAAHVAYSLPGHPELVWASFEHSAGTPDYSSSDGRRNVAPISPRDVNPTTVDPAVATDDTVVSTDPHLVLFRAGTQAKDADRPIADAELRLDSSAQTFADAAGRPTQTSIYRMYPASLSETTATDGAIVGLNYAVEKMFASAGLPASDRRGHYRLVGALWMDKPNFLRVDSSIQNDATSPFVTGPHRGADGSTEAAIPLQRFLDNITADGPDSPLSIVGGEDRMSGTATESFTQAGDSLNNCFSCHNTQATTADGVPLDRDQSPRPIKLLDPGFLNLSRLFSQIVLEECTAPENLFDNGDGTLSAVCP